MSKKAELIKHEPVMEMMTQLFGGITDAHTPGIDPSTGMIGLYWHAKKMEKRAAISDHEARIAQNEANKFSARTDLIGKVMALPLTIQMATEQARHQKKLFKLEQKKLALENQVLETEALRGASELKLTLKEIARGLKDGPSED